MYFVQVSRVSLLQYIVMPSFSSDKVLGLCLSLRKVFTEPYSSSMGLWSGLSTGLFHPLMLFLAKKFWTYLLVCLGSLSWKSLCWFGYFSRMNGTRAAASISPYFAFIIPLKSTMCVAPSLEMPAHMCTEICDFPHRLSRKSVMDYRGSPKNSVTNLWHVPYTGTFKEAKVATYRQRGESDTYSQSFTLTIRYCTIAKLVPLSMADRQYDA